jgi:hypothetical protein
VTITCYRLPGGKPLPAGEESTVIKTQGRAVKHAVVFEKEIVAGANAIDFEMTQGKKID